MSDKTGIEWTDATWNPVTGCAKVSAGCKHCYALREWPRMAANPKTVYYGREFTDVRCHPERLEQPLRWTRPRMVFVNSMSDLFHPDVPDAFIDQVFVVMALAPQHTFQVLTKRPERMLAYMTDGGRPRRVGGNTGWMNYNGVISPWPFANVWMGVSMENQEAADERIPLLMQTPAAVRWISAEPLLGAVDVSRFLEFYSGPGDAFRLDWVVAGGESGPHARLMHPDWVRSLRDQCTAAGVPFLFKQWGEWAPYDRGRTDRSLLPADARNSLDMPLGRPGKKAAGRLLDGRTWDGYPV